MFIFLKDGRRYYTNALDGVEQVGNDIVVNSMKIDNGVTIKQTIEIPKEFIEDIWEDGGNHEKIER